MSRLPIEERFCFAAGSIKPIAVTSFVDKRVGGRTLHDPINTCHF